MKEKENKSIELSEFKDKIINLFSERITDYVFLMIQNDRDLMGKYLHIIEESNSLKNVNSQIAQKIRVSFNLDTLGEKEENPQSFLIQRHDKFTIKKD